MRRLSNVQKSWGPITVGHWHNGLGFKIESGDDEDPECTLIVHGFGRAFRTRLPQIVKPWRRQVVARTWDAATVARMGRNWYWDIQPRAFGLSLSDDFLQVFFGRQTDDSETEQRWSYFLPWKQWRHVRDSFYGLTGELFWTSPPGFKKFGADGWAEWSRAKDSVPRVVFEFADFDGQRIEASTCIEEREYRLGEKWCKCLSLFRRPRIHRSLDISFSAEVGPEKGSWKGGTMGHGIEMRPGELHEDAFRRYCDEQHSAKGARYRIAFGRRLEA